MRQGAIAKCFESQNVFNYKMPQFYYKMRQLIQNASNLLQNALVECSKLKFYWKHRTSL